MSLPETYKALFAAPKHGEKYTFREIPLSKPGRDEVVVKVEFAPINPIDIITMTANVGSLETKLVGTEGSGTVVAVGQELETQFNIGDKVHIIGPGTMAQYLVAKTEKVFPVRDHLSLEEAASHIINPGAVYSMGVLAEKGNHKAVIHTAGTSAVGRMLIRLLKRKGITSINIVRRDDYTEDLKKEGADYVLNSKNADFWDKLKEVAGKEQATIAFDALGGEFSGKVISAMPAKSNFYLYGDFSGEAGISHFSIVDLFQGKTAAGLAWHTLFDAESSKEKRRELFDEVHSLLPTVFKSEVHKVFKLEELEEALAYQKEHGSKGKILLKPN